ncbi:hypothetical protein G9A89_006237 [Geosiphon pyriformis]|nr:hypothetical protein G9A89_006237 [Geosiphon pyriformis]
MKKAAKESGSGGGLRPVLPRKKRRDGVLDDVVEAKMDSTDGSASHSWGSETGNMTKSESVNMEEKCLVKETSFQQKSEEELSDSNADMTLKNPKKTVTK